MAVSQSSKAMEVGYIYFHSLGEFVNGLIVHYPPVMDTWEFLPVLLNTKVTGFKIPENFSFQVLFFNPLITFQ
jgi:hypothetical protein